MTFYNQEDALFQVDVRDVVQHQKDKSYSSLGEAFESYFYDSFAIVGDQVVNTHVEELDPLDIGDQE